MLWGCYGQILKIQIEMGHENVSSSAGGQQNFLLFFNKGFEKYLANVEYPPPPVLDTL